MKSLVDVFTAIGHHLDDKQPESLVLRSRNCMHESAIITFQSLETHSGVRQYQKYTAHTIDKITASIYDTIKKNSLPLLKYPNFNTFKSKSAQQLIAQGGNGKSFWSPLNQQQMEILKHSLLMKIKVHSLIYGLPLEAFVFDENQLSLPAWNLETNSILSIILKANYWTSLSDAHCLSTSAAKTITE